MFITFDFTIWYRKFQEKIAVDSFMGGMQVWAGSGQTKHVHYSTAQSQGFELGWGQVLTLCRGMCFPLGDITSLDQCSLLL